MDADTIIGVKSKCSSDGCDGRRYVFILVDGGIRFLCRKCFRELSPEDKRGWEVVSIELKRVEDDD